MMSALWVKGIVWEYPLQKGQAHDFLRLQEVGWMMLGYCKVKKGQKKKDQHWVTE